MPLAQGTKLLLTSTLTGGVSFFLATRARGTLGTSTDSLAADVSKSGWARTFVVPVAVNRLVGLGPDYVQPVAGSNAHNVNIEQLFKRYISSTLGGEALRERCAKVKALKLWQAAVEGDDTPAEGSETTIVIPHYAEGLEVESERKDEVLFREKGTGLRVWLGLRESKPQWVGDTHNIEYYYTVVLNPEQAGGVLDYVMYVIDVWQARRVLNEGARTASNKQMAFVAKHKHRD